MFCILIMNYFFLACLWFLLKIGYFKYYSCSIWQLLNIPFSEILFNTLLSFYVPIPVLHFSPSLILPLLLLPLPTHSSEWVRPSLGSQQSLSYQLDTKSSSFPHIKMDQGMGSKKISLCTWHSFRWHCNPPQEIKPCNCHQHSEGLIHSHANSPEVSP